MGVLAPALTGHYPVVIRHELHNRTPLKTLYGVLHIEEDSWTVSFCVAWFNCKATRGVVLPAPSGFVEFTELSKAATLYNQLSYAEADDDHT